MIKKINLKNAIEFKDEIEAILKSTVFPAHISIPMLDPNAENVLNEKRNKISNDINLNIAGYDFVARISEQVYIAKFKGEVYKLEFEIRSAEKWLNKVSDFMNKIDQKEEINLNKFSSLDEAKSVEINFEPVSEAFKTTTKIKINEAEKELTEMKDKLTSMLEGIFIEIDEDDLTLISKIVPNTRMVMISE